RPRPPTPPNSPSPPPETEARSSPSPSARKALCRRLEAIFSFAEAPEDKSDFELRISDFARERIASSQPVPRQFPEAPAVFGDQLIDHFAGAERRRQHFPSVGLEFE